MRKILTAFALASAISIAGCSKQKLSKEPEQKTDTAQQEQIIDLTLYADKEEKKYQLPDDFYMTDPNFIDSKDTLESMIRKADHDFKFLKWSYGYNNQYDFGLPKSNELGEDFPEDSIAFNKDPKSMQLTEFTQSLTERKGTIEREQIISVETGYEHINLVDYIKAINSQQAVSDQSILTMASKFQGFNINKIFYKKEDLSRIKVMYWTKEKALSVSDIEVDPAAFGNFLAIYNQLHSEKKPSLCGAMYISYTQYQTMKKMAQQDISAAQIFGRIDSELEISEQKFISVSNLKAKGIRLYSAGKEQKTSQLDLSSESMETIQKYYDATKSQ